MSTASKVAAHKAKHPELYCPYVKCLWRTGGPLCPRHAKALAIAPYKAQAQIGVTMTCEHCKWKIINGLCAPHCIEHDAPYKAQAKRIADAYNQLAKAERRKDLEEDNA